MNPTKRHTHIVPGFRDIKYQGQALISKCLICKKEVVMLNNPALNKWMTIEEIEAKLAPARKAEEKKKIKHEMIMKQIDKLSCGVNRVKINGLE